MGGGGGGGGVGGEAYNFGNFDLRYELKGKARTRPDIFRVVLRWFWVHVRPRSKKMGPKTKIYTKRDVTIRFVSKK